MITVGDSIVCACVGQRNPGSPLWSCCASWLMRWCYQARAIIEDFVFGIWKLGSTVYYSLILVKSDIPLVFLLGYAKDQIHQCNRKHYINCRVINEAGLRNTSVGDGT